MAACNFGVVVFPGSNCEQDVLYALRFLGHEATPVWHQETNLDSYDALVLPGGFSYGDYLRCGAVARFSPVMEALIRYAKAGRPVLGICNGFQILTEAQLLPGALIRNAKLKFICENAPVRVEKSVCKWLDLAPGTVLNVPINHGEGNFICDEPTLDALNSGEQVVLRYCEPAGAPVANATTGAAQAANATTGVAQAAAGELGGFATNGSLDDIAGICNKAGNVFGLMPHPERVVDGVSGGTDGAPFFSAIISYAREVAGK
ncbi:MAG: phosphoribosylformylglycinamidine synthase subunit PurQ [Coriobacteriales bacterium]|jgi:phosphoribosylformylglycinamidine synthase|nr:phosphoribosylformylglycinamidine synthase subunit PurQ [Coriobacteriales bacterium]